MGTKKDLNIRLCFIFFGKYQLSSISLSVHVVCHSVQEVQSQFHSVKSTIYIIYLWRGLP